MIDFAKIEDYRENNRIEAKRALGGLPHSIWESYSAFSNTMGGIILLGVEEYKDHSLHTVDLPDPKRLIDEFWAIVNDRKKVSVNILNPNDVTVEEIHGHHIIAIRIPRAQRADKPVYIGTDPFTGSYRRSGEGDYRCKKEEVDTMLRDASRQTLDMLVFDHLSLDVLSKDSICRYRAQMLQIRTSCAWEALSEEEFLRDLGAAGRGTDEKLHPTAAGLLMFGKTHEIVKEYPRYSLLYQEEGLQITSSSGDKNGNLYDFYFQVHNRLTSGKNHFETQDEAAFHLALREALANCLINADYYGKNGIVIAKKSGEITFSNPGSFRIDLERAKSGGVSDPRNSALVKMFALINVGKGTGSGIPHIFSVWKKQGWSAPVITEHFDPDRITLILPIGKGGETETLSNTVFHRQAVVEYLTENILAKKAELSALLGLSPDKTSEILSELLRDKIIVAEGREDPVYKLNA